MHFPDIFAAWFASRGWALRAHQRGMIDAAADGVDALLIAPTGGGKTLGGFLPSLVELARDGCGKGLHTLYVSPLKALTTDVARNLQSPVAEMGLAVTIETRTGDTPQNRRVRQRKKPPDILLTTPESLALLLSYPDAITMFKGLRRVVVDELHALVESKRGELLALGIARLRTLAPGMRLAALSATIADPPAMLRWLGPDPSRVRLVKGEGGAQPEVDILLPDAHIPWSGHMALFAADALLEVLKGAGMTLVFVNTRAQSELMFSALWRINKENLPIGLHHGSLAIEQRRKVEAAMAAGKLRAVVATSSLDLGIDWGDIDLVVQVGAPKGVSRLTQRIGRANHRLNEASRALLIPANRFELLECLAASDALAAGELDGPPPGPGGLDVLAQHLHGTACAGPFSADAIYAEVLTTAPYADLARKDFDDVLAFVATGGYALQTYDRFRRLEQGEDGLWRLAAPGFARQYRMNVGTIVEQPTLKVRLGRGRLLGEVEEYFVSQLAVGDTFLFAGRHLRFDGMRDLDVMASLAKPGGRPLIPAYAGGRLPLSTHLASRVRHLLATPAEWPRFAPALQEWLEFQAKRSVLPPEDGLLVESFERGGRCFTMVYAFAGRNAHQTLGMLLTRRMQRAELRPLGFVASDYCLAVWSLQPVEDVDALFDVDMLGLDLEDWMAESSMLKRTFRTVAVIAGLIERRHPGQQKTGRQVTFNSDLIYDVLRKHEPDHVLLRATRAEAAAGLTDIRRLADVLVAVQGRIDHRRLDRISPFAVPLIATIGREFVDDGVDEMLTDALEELIAEAMAPDEAA